MTGVPCPLRMRERFELQYSKFNKKSFISPDPLQFLHLYSKPEDMEVCGLIASSLAFGNVRQILKAVSAVLDKLGSSPYAFTLACKEEECLRLFSDFRYRFVGGKEMASFLLTTGAILRKHGSLENCFRSHMKNESPTVFEGICGFAEEFGKISKCGYLMPDPSKGSACKRLNLFLRWMVRKDDVDPGIWTSIHPARLIIPLDVHMWRHCVREGLTTRKSPDMKSALEISARFREISPDDPIKYDFSITRSGIWNSSKIKIP